MRSGMGKAIILLTAVLLLRLIAGCAGSEGGDGGQQHEQSDDVGGKSETLHNAKVKIAFESFRHGNGDIYTIKADGKDLIRLTDHPAMEGFPTWAPDGEKIAFVSDRNGNNDIYTMNADGTGVARLTDHRGMVGSPAWQPVD
jgi:hypothetical protein